MRLTLNRAVCGYLVVVWGTEWALWGHPEVARKLAPLLTAVRVVLLCALGAYAVHVGRRWSAPVAPISAGVFAAFGVALVGVLTGQFARMQLGPAYVLANLIANLVVATVAGTIGVLGMCWFVRARRQAHAAGGAAAS